MRGRKNPGGHRRSVKRDIGGDRRKRLLDLRRERPDDCTYPFPCGCGECQARWPDDTDGRCLNCGGEGGGGTMDPDDWIECRVCSGTGKAP